MVLVVVHANMMCESLDGNAKYFYIRRLYHSPLNFATLKFRHPWLIFVSVVNSMSITKQFYTQIKIDTLHIFTTRSWEVFTIVQVQHATLTEYHLQKDAKQTLPNNQIFVFNSEMEYIYVCIHHNSQKCHRTYICKTDCKNVWFC